MIVSYLFVYMVCFFGYLFSKSSIGYILSNSVALDGSKTVAISQISQTTVYKFINFIKFILKMYVILFSILFRGF